MAAKVEALPANQPQQDLVLQLERLLEEARSGELQGIAYAVTYVASEVSHGWFFHNNRMRLIGELEQVKWHLLSQDGD